MQITRRLVRSTLVLGMLAGTGLVPATAEAQLRRSGDRVLFLIPLPGSPDDSGFARELGHLVRSRMESKFRRKLRIVPDQHVEQLLINSGLEPNAILEPPIARKLARTLGADAYIIGTLSRDPTKTNATFRLVDRYRSGLSGWVTVDGPPDDSPRKFADRVIDSLRNQVKAAEHARDCFDGRDRGHLKKAREHAERAFKLYPNHPSSAICLAHVFEAIGQPVDSLIWVLEKATLGDSLLESAWRDLARHYQQAGDARKAAEALSRLFAANPAVIAVAGSAASPAGAQELPQTIYDTLEALTPDDIRALTEKAEAGDGEAQQMLGLAYHHGYTVDQIYAEAVKWYRLAADQGFAHAQDGLGKLYYLGQGVEQDFGEALRWIRLAVEQGLPEGQYGYGVMLLEGKGVRQNVQEAFAWLSRAAERGHVEAFAYVGGMYLYGIGTSQDARVAERWLLRGARHGIAMAYTNLGMMYADGLGVSPDSVEALMWFRLADWRGGQDARQLLQELEPRMREEDAAEARLRAEDQRFLKQRYAAFLDAETLKGFLTDFAEAYPPDGPDEALVVLGYEPLVVLGEVIARHPENAMARVVRSVMLRRAGMYEQSLADATAAIERDSSLAVAWANRAAIHRNLLEYRRALADATVAIQLDSTLALAYDDRAATFNSLGEHENALADAMTALVIEVFTGLEGGTGPVDFSQTFLAGAVDERPERLSGPYPRYPEMLRQAGIEGFVLLEFVIDTSGHVEEGSLKVLQSTNRAFEGPAKVVITRSLYRPGRVRGQPVRVLVSQRMGFTIQRND